MAVPATWMAPGSIRPLEGVSAAPSSNYPVPAPLAQPKHLFHLILRGEGLGDLGATGLIKDLAGETGGLEGAKDPAKPEAAAGPRLNPSLTFILRYEGEGIIDNTVADVLKEIYGPKNAGQNCSSGAIGASCFGGLIGTASGHAAPTPQGLSSPPPSTGGPPAPATPRPPVSESVPPTQPPQGPPAPPSL
jgi:hypothetical protein